MLKTAALQLYNSHSSQHTGQTLINLPFVDNQTLSVLITVDNNSESSQEFVQAFLNLLKDLATEVEIKTSNQPLEKLLGELNKRVPRLPKASHFLTQLNCALVWQNPPELHFTACGHIKIFLIKEALIKEINLEKTDGQIFQQILQGKLQENDSLMFATYSLLDYVSEEKIKKTLTTLPLSGALAYLENILSKAPQKSCFWALAIKATEKEVNAPLAAPITPHVASQQAPSSIDQLLSTKKQTANILASPTFSEFAKTQGFNLLKNTGQKYLPIIWVLFKQGSRDYFVILGSGLKTAAKLARRRNWPQLKSSQKSFWQDLISRWQSLAKAQKAAILLIIIILAIFTQNLKWQTNFLASTQVGGQWEQTANLIADDLSKIEAALIYNDKKTATNLLTTVDPLINQAVPLQWANKFSQFKQNLDSLKSRIWKIDQTKESVWLDLQSLKQPLTPERLLASSDQRVYLIAKEKQMYVFDTNNGQRQAPKLSDNFPFLPTLTAPLINTKSFLGVTNQKKAYTVNDFSFQELTWTTSQLAQPTDLAVYNSRIYVTDNQNQILRYTLNGKNLSEETSWLKAPLANGVKELGVDGDLYLINNQGILEKYNRGTKANWSVEPIDLTLATAHLWVGQTTNRLYLFDSTNSRLILYDKSGQLVGQLTNSLFNQAIDWTILEKNKQLLITTKDKIYSFQLPS